MLNNKYEEIRNKKKHKLPSKQRVNRNRLSEEEEEEEKKYQIKEEMMISKN